MNTPNPFVPQGSILEQKNRTRSRLRLAFFCVLAINIIPITLALLMQGCRKPAETEAPPPDTNPVVTPFEPTSAPPVETLPPESNTTATFQPPGETTPITAAPATQTIPTPPPAPATEYKVVKGDTLTTIAAHFGITVKALQEANPTVVPTRLQIGQTLQIPPPAPKATTPTGLAAPETGTIGQQTYKVKSGDTLTKIAKDFGTTVSALRSENNLTTDRIKVGQVLKIPVKASPTAAPSGTNGAM